MHFGDVLQLAHAHTGAALVIDVSDKVSMTAGAKYKLSVQQEEKHPVPAPRTEAEVPIQGGERQQHAVRAIVCAGQARAKLVVH